MEGAHERRLDRIDGVVSRSVVHACKRDAVARAAMKRLAAAGWTYSGCLGAYASACADSLNQKQQKLIVLNEGEAALHAPMAVFLFGLGPETPKTLRRLDPTGHLFQRPGQTLYARRRVDGRPLLFAHPAIVRYVRGLTVTPSQHNESERRQKKKHQRGGNYYNYGPKCTIGKGKEGSVVFDSRPTCIREFVPHAHEACVMRYDASSGECGDLQWLHGKLGHRLLLKINKDATDTSDELAANRKIHQWLTEKHFLHYTPLHEHVSCVALQDRAGRRIATLVATARMQGDVTKLPFSERDFYAMAKVTLLVLHVLHSHDHLHLDVKPQNIFYSEVHDQRRRTFALADFGIVEHMSKVHSDLLRGSYSGTYGFMSPLLLDYGDDGQNKVYPIFIQVARESRGVRISREDLAGLFEEEVSRLKNRARMPKIDLHSVGLTMYEILERQKHFQFQGPERKRAINFIDRLLFFGENDFMNTYQALEYVCSLDAGMCSDIGMVRH